MEKVYGSPVRQDGLIKVGKNEWELIYGFGEDENGGWNWRQRFRYLPTPEEIASIINAQIDEATDEKIAHGLVWNELPVTLDTEAQTNILGVLVSLPLGDSMFPMTFKLGDFADGTPAFYEFKSSEEFASFAKAATDHKQAMYSEGWTEKMQLNLESFNPK